MTRPAYSQTEGTSSRAYGDWISWFFTDVDDWRVTLPVLSAFSKLITGDFMVYLTKRALTAFLLIPLMDRV